MDKCLKVFLEGTLTYYTHQVNINVALSDPLHVEANVPKGQFWDHFCISTLPQLVYDHIAPSNTLYSVSFNDLEKVSSIYIGKKKIANLP